MTDFWNDTLDTVSNGLSAMGRQMEQNRIASEGLRQMHDLQDQMSWEDTVNREARDRAIRAMRMGIL